MHTWETGDRTVQTRHELEAVATEYASDVEVRVHGPTTHLRVLCVGHPAAVRERAHASVSEPVRHGIILRARAPAWRGHWFVAKVWLQRFPTAISEGRTSSFGCLHLKYAHSALDSARKL